METTQKPLTVTSAGKEVETIDATFSPQFLALLSEHLYSSPNKAFEELISNSWDAGATEVYIKIPEILTSSNPAIWILDNGNSMDIAGLTQLWSIADSKKRIDPSPERKQIGKFGIGKLATYVLCNELTYICKAQDGIIRAVTMDYRRIDQAKERHLDKLSLSVREINNTEELKEVLHTYELGEDILGLIKNGIPSIKNEATIDEYGGAPQNKILTKSTWTLAILTSLKKSGAGIQEGWIRRLLSTALPLGTTISIELNGNLIKPSKSNKSIQKQWKLGPDLDFDEFALDDTTNVQIQKFDDPYPHITVDGLGEITGTATLYETNIRGGKSEQIGDSNGFFVNVLGRVINPEDNLFKMSDLNLSVLSQFRATIRVDGLDKQISANREAIAESQELKIVRGLLRKLFNLARREFAKLEDKKFVDAAKTPKDNIGNVPVIPLTTLIDKTIKNNEDFPPFVHIETQDEESLRKEKKAWIEDTKEHLSDSISSVEFRDETPQNSLVKYDLKSRTIVINKNHPFAKENTHTTEQINTLKDTAIVDLLTDAYILNCGISTDTYIDIVQHRDRAMRLIAQIRRNSAAQIIANLNDWTNEAKPFEHIVGDALEYLGLTVQRYGGSGEPEGVATAYVSPTIDDLSNVYTLTYDAKSTIHGKTKTGNVKIAGLARHRREYNADYALVVAPSFQEGALESEAQESKVTPMPARILAKLVSLTVGFGPINLEKLREVFSCFTPKSVEEWVNKLESDIRNRTNVDIQILVKALELLVTKDRIDIIGCDAIAQKYREIAGTGSRPSRSEIAQVIRGLSLVAPNAIFMDSNQGWDVFVFTKPSMLIQELKRQTQNIPDTLKLGIIENQ